MRNTVRDRLVRLTAACLVFAAARASAQAPEVPTLPAPRSLTDSTRPEAAAVAPASLQQPPPYGLPPADNWTTAALPFPDPLLDRPGAPLPGPFVNVETNYLGVHFRNQLQIAVPVNAAQTDTVQFPGPKLDDALSPRFEVGCRLEDGWGELLIGYRFLNTQGGNGVLAAEGPGQASGRLALNTFDFGYASQEFSLGPAWDMRWRVGARATILYYDARLAFGQPADDQGLLLTGQREVNYFWGLGPWANLELSRKTCVPGLSVFGRLEDSLQFGHITQTGVEDFVGSPEALNKVGFEVTVLTLAEEFGVSYTAPEWNHSRFLLGYQFETYFQAGRFNFTSSRGQLDTQGLFLRAEFYY